MIELLGMLSGASASSPTYHEDKFLDPKFAKQKEIIQELAANFLTLKDEDIASATEVTTGLAKCFNNCFSEIKSAHKKGNNSLDIEAAINAIDTTSLFESVQKAKSIGLFASMESLIPKNTPPEIAETWKKVFKDLSNAKTPEDLKKSVIDPLKDPKNVEDIKDLKETLGSALKTPGIIKLVNIITNPKIIKSISSLVKSKAGKNLAKVLANKESTALQIGAAKARFIARAIPKLASHMPSIVRAIKIGMEMDSIERKDREARRPEREFRGAVDDMLSMGRKLGEMTKEDESKARNEIEEIIKKSAKDPSIPLSYQMKVRSENISHNNLIHSVLNAQAPNKQSKKARNINR